MVTSAPHHPLHPPERPRPRKPARTAAATRMPCAAQSGSRRKRNGSATTRFWVAEHHGMPGIASSAPAVLIAGIAAATERIRVGSGGVMLPNHAPLVVAEQFGTLRALYGDRIDLGIGRAPGTDGATAMALRRSAEGLGVEDFPQQLLDLFGFFYGGTQRLQSAAHDHRRPRARRRTAGLAPRVERIQRPGRGGARTAVRVRAPFRGREHRGGARPLPLALHAERHPRPSRTA